MGRLGSSSSQPLDFTDGDTQKRFTIVDSSLEGTELITPSIQRQQVADVDDYGWSFIANICQVRRGSFDVLVTAQSGDANIQAGEYPNEIITLNYIID